MLQPNDLLGYVRGVHDRTYEAVALLDAHIAASRAQKDELDSVFQDFTNLKGTPR